MKHKLWCQIIHENKKLQRFQVLVIGKIYTPQMLYKYGSSLVH